MITLLVASTGGHLKQLYRLHGRLPGAGRNHRWATFDTPQSRSLLAEETVDFVPFVGSRDPLNVLKNLPEAHRILREHPVDTLVSTGASVAVPFFALARARRLTCHYVESAARSDGPSMTGRIISRLPGVHLYSQYPAWASGRWNYGGSVFDSFERSTAVLPRPERLSKVVVTLGTFRGYGFVRLVRRLLDVLPASTEVLWQTGDTGTNGLGIDGKEALPERDLVDAMRDADVVVAHAGVGSALSALEVGKCPVLVPRRLARGEHVDDHQVQIADELADRGLAISVDADDLSHGTLLSAAVAQVEMRTDEPMFGTASPRRQGSW